MRPRTKPFLRLLQLWRVHAYLDLLWVTRSLKQFLLWYIADGILAASAVSGMLLLAERFAGVGAWTKFQVIFLLGYGGTVNGLVALFFSYNVMFISRRLGRGQLDHTLIQPQPLWMSLLTEGFTPFASSSILLPGLGLMLWAFPRLGLTVTPGWAALLLINLFASCAVVVAFQFLWGSAAFWAPRGAEEINSSTNELIMQLKSYPLDGLGPVLTGGLLTVLPVGFVGWYPCRSLLGVDPSFWGGFVTPLAALLFGLLAAAVFRKGLRHYARVGSQRYLSFGHRG
jgi:ABC-2 type transport system permease protein